MSVADRLHNKDSQIKQILTRTANLSENLSPEDRAALKAKVEELLGEEEEAHYPEDEEIREFLRTPQEDRNYDELIASLQHEIGELNKLYTEATDDVSRLYRDRRRKSLAHLVRVVEAAKRIPAESRTFGCRTQPTVRVSTRGTAFPSIEFRRHIFTTDDPLRIARLLDYMENKESSDPVIEVIPAGHVALINHLSGEFSQWANKVDAREIVRANPDILRLAYR